MLGTRFDLAEALVGIAQRGDSASDSLVGGDAVPGVHCGELELQMAEVARALHRAHPRTSCKCPICDSRMQLNGGRVVSEFAALGVEQHDLECDTCGLVTMRAYHASHGYRDGAG